MANMALVCELVFCNANTFENIDIDQAKVLVCTSKYARENPNIAKEIAKDKAYAYLDILYNNVRDTIISNRKSGIESFYVRDEVIINDLMEEDDTFRDMFKSFLIHDYTQFLIENYIDAWDNMDNKEFSKYYKKVVARLNIDYEEMLRREIVLEDTDIEDLIAEHHRL